MKRQFSLRRWKREIAHFARRHTGWLLIAAAAIIIVVIVIVGSRFNKTEKPSPSTQEEQMQEDVEMVTDEDMLAGITGDSQSLDGSNTKDLPAKIGVSALHEYGQASALLQGLEELGSVAEQVGTIEEFIIYNARDSENQQIQDIYSMINDGVRVLIVAESTPYNFAKIIEIAAKNNVQIVAYNQTAEEGFAVNVKNVADPSADFLQALKEAGVQSAALLGATPKQEQQLEESIEITGSYADMWDLVYQINTSVEEESPLESALVFDYNANDILCAWLKYGKPPKAVMGGGTVAFVKSWYELTHEGVEVEGADEEEVRLVAVSPREFTGMAFTYPQNAGEILYAFAENLAQGRELKQQNYVYELDEYDIITSDNLDDYYEQIKDEQSGLVVSEVETKDIDPLFAESTNSIENNKQKTENE